MSISRAAIFLSQVIGSPFAVLAQDMPNITTTDNARSLTFAIDNTPTKDGEGNTVGSISKMSVTVVEAQGKKTFYSIDYDFYNGSGTWRGGQMVNVQFKNMDHATVSQISFPLDRGHCVYGKPEPRHVEGSMENVIALVQRVDVMVTPVSGVQTRC